MARMVFDVGGTAIKYSVMDETLKRRHSGEVPTPLDTQEHFFAVIEEIYRRYEAETDGIAMSLPGFINTETGYCSGGGHLTFNHRRSIAPELSAICGCPVKIANDGKCAALAELRLGSLKGCRNAGVYIFGTGVGGGVIVDGKVISGVHGTAGEYSFMRVQYDKWEDPENTVGITCSTTGLLNRYKRLRGIAEEKGIDGRLFFERVNGGEPEAVEALRGFSRLVAKNIADLTILLDMERVAVGGGISAQPVLLEALKRELDDLYADSGLYFDPGLPKPELVRCRFGSEANQVGAYLYYEA